MFLTRWFSTVFAFSCFFAVFSAGCQPSVLASINFSEHFEKSVPVSGTVLTGVQYASAEPLSRKSLMTWIPTSHAARLCLSVISDDGRYRASSEFILPPNLSGFTTLDYPTSNFKELREYGPNRIAALGVLQNSCNGEGIIQNAWLLPVSWSPIRETDHIILRINSGGADVQLFTRPQGPLLDCTKGSVNDARVAFDTNCDLTKISQGNFWSGYVIQTRFGETPTQTAFNIWTSR